PPILRGRPYLGRGPPRLDRHLYRRPGTPGACRCASRRENPRTHAALARRDLPRPLPEDRAMNSSALALTYPLWRRARWFLLAGVAYVVLSGAIAHGMRAPREVTIFLSL